MNEDLRKWFGKGKEGDWVRVGTDGEIKGDCAREPGEGKPKCMPRSKAHSMGKDDRATAARRKRREDPVADRKGKGNKPVMVNTEEFMMEGNEPTNPSLWSKAKSLAKQKFDVYPSAYANGWASKYYKSRGGGWKSVSEEAVDEAANPAQQAAIAISMKKAGKKPKYKGMNELSTATLASYKQFDNDMKKEEVDLEIEICETADAGLAAKAAKSGISIGTLRKVYRRGVAAWNSGHRPGTTPQQWGMARVNSYIGKGSGTYGGADKDLHEGDTSNLPRVAKDKDSGLPKKYVAGLSNSTAKARAAHFAKADKLSDSDPEAYKPAPGDATAKTKPSKHTLKYRAMFGEDMDEELYEACWDTHKQIGMKKKGNRMVPDCVPEATDIIAKAKAAVAKKAGVKLKLDPDTGTPDHFTAAQRRKKGLDEALTRVTSGGYPYKPGTGDIKNSKEFVKEELGKSNEWGRPELRKKYAAMTPGQESMTADKIPSFDPRYDDVTTQHLGLHPFREGYLAEISAKASVARDDFRKKMQKALTDPKNIARAKKVLAKKKEAEKAKEAPHLVMQLRKAVSIGSKVHFQDGQHHAISGNHADTFMSKYNSTKSSIEKEALQKRAHKSHAEFMRTIAEDHSPDCEPMDDMGTHHVDSYEAHRGSGDQISPVISHDDEDIRFQDFDETAFEKELEADVLSLSWDDLVDLYDEDEIEYDDSPEEEGEDLEEGITPAGRLKKKFNAMRSKSRRMMARNIAIKRVSSPEKLKSRSIRAARRMVYKRLLRNRDISTVSSSEKTRLEAQIKRMAPMVARLSVRVMPAVRKLEQSRIKNSRMKKRK